MVSFSRVDLPAVLFGCICYACSGNARDAGDGGGDPANVYHVTSRGDSGAGTLRAALESTEDYWIVFDVEGDFELNFDDKVRVMSNKTVDGRFCFVPCPDPSPHGGGNDFVVSKKGLVNDWAPDRTVGFTRSVGDLLLNDATVAVHEPGRVFDRADFYAATVEPATPALKEAIRTGAGPRTDYCH